MPLEVATAPTLIALTKTEVKNWKKLEPGETIEDTLLDGLIGVATELAEHEFNRTLLTTTYTYTVSKLKGKIELPNGPIQSISSIAYLDVDGVSQSFDASNYSLIKGYIPFIHIPGNISLPTLYSYDPYPVTITYVAGWDAVAAVPDSIKLWMKTLIGAYYQERTPLTPVTISEIKGYMNRLKGSQRVWQFT